MITHRWIERGVAYVIIACGCCQHEFIVEVGGEAFCTSCINGHHRDCKLPEIFGIKR